MSYISQLNSKKLNKQLFKITVNNVRKLKNPLHKLCRLPKLKEWIDKNDPGAPLIPFSGALESKLMEMDAEERKAYLKEHNITRLVVTCA